MLTQLTRWYGNADILRMATGTNGELLAVSGPRNPYPGKLGVVEEGALADLLVTDGNPIEDISLLENPEKNSPDHHEGRKDLQGCARFLGVWQTSRERGTQLLVSE